MFTSVIHEPGANGEAVGLGQAYVAPHLGLLAVAEVLPSAPSETESELGRVAARLAVDQVRAHVERNVDVLDRFRRTPTAELQRQVLALLGEAFTRAAHETFAFARRRGALALTLDVALLLDHEAFVGHVGGGRVYLIRRGLVHQLTVDPLREEDLFDEGGSSPAGATRVADANLLGVSPQVEPEMLCIELAPEDRFVVCGPSIHRVLPDGILHTRLCSEHLDHLPASLAHDAPYAPLLGACAQLDSVAPFTADSAQARLALLAPMPLFAHCTERELRSVARATHPRRFRAGALVFEEGQPGTELYLVLSGGVQVLKHDTIIAELPPGSTFGEMALLDEPTRSATVVTAADTELMVISRQAFFSMLRDNPRLAVKVLWNLLLGLSANLRRTNERVAFVEQELARALSFDQSS